MHLFTVRAAELGSRAERGRRWPIGPGTQRAHGFLGTVGSPLDQGIILPARPDGVAASARPSRPPRSCSLAAQCSPRTQSPGSPPGSPPAANRGTSSPAPTETRGSRTLLAASEESRRNPSKRRLKLGLLSRGLARLRWAIAGLVLCEIERSAK